MNCTSVCSLEADGAFGPQVQSCRDDFDFTLLFEQSIFSIAPTALLMLVSVPRIFQLHRRTIKTTPTPLRHCKNFAIVCLACLRLALLILWSTEEVLRTRVAIATASLTFIGSLTLVALSNFEHTRSLRPSFIINTYLFFTTLFDLTQMRTLWLIPSTQTLASLFTACVAVNVLVLVLESIEKRSFLRIPYNLYSPEALSGIFNRSVFWWLNSLFFKGYRSILQAEDLYDTDQELSSQNLQECMNSAWQKYGKSKKYGLVKTTFSATKVPLAKTIFPRLCVIAFKLSQPLLINRAISLVSQPRTTSSRNQGFGLIGATALVYIGLAIGNAKYKHRSYRVITMVRGGLVCLISDTTLTRSEISKDSAAVTLMSTDVDRIVAGLEHLNFIWASPIEIMIALYLLWRQVGLACLMPLGISLVSATGAFFVGKASANAQKRWVDAVQKRVGITASMLGSMKAVKMMGWSALFAERVKDLKSIELKQSNRFRYITTIRNTISNFSLIMAPALTFAVYTGAYLHASTGHFSPATALTSLSIITLISQSIQWWINALTIFQASLGCYERIEKYLQSDTRRDTRSHLDPSFPGQSEKHGTNNGHVISLERVQSSYEGNDVPTITDINLNVTASSLVMVIGPIGCGKTTLLKTILGEMPSVTGEAEIVTQPVGYCPQEPWLPNYTVQNIVTDFRDFDDTWYNTVINACALEEDIGGFASGHDTIIGSKGISLSGGQKQRLSLARALYARTKILLLDDILSGLDKKTENAVFHRVLGSKGLCREHRVTVVFATHAFKYLSQADHIVLLNKNGSISEQGSLKDLTTHNFEIRKETLEPDSMDDSVTKAMPQVRVTVEPKLEPQSKNRSSGDSKIYYYYARAIGWVLGLYLSAALLTTFFIKFPDLWLRWWAVAEASHPGQRTAFYLGIYGMFGGLAVIFMVLSILLLFTIVMPRSSAHLHKRLLETVISAPYTFLVTTDSGVILNRFSQDMALIDMQLPTALLQTVDGLMSCIAMTMLIAASSKLVVTIVPGVLVILYFLQRFYLRTSRQMRLLDIEFKSPLYSHFLETLSGLQSIRAFKWEANWGKRGRELLDRSQRPFYLLYCIQRWLELSLDTMVAVCAIIVITLATQIKDRSPAVGGALGVALVNLLMLSGALSYLIRAWTEMETSISAVMRIRDFEASTPSERDTLEEFVQIPTEWPQDGLIEFNSFDASYELPSMPAEQNHGPQLVLKDINISIPARSRMGICGRTGSGKSSLLLALFRMIETTSGSIMIDGIDISTIPRSTLRERILCVPQSPEMFPGTIRENLDPFNKHSDENITSVLQRVGLWPVIEARGGLEADASTPLSAGEQQVFALAYALLRRAGLGGDGGILVLDEFSASVDIETERSIMKIAETEFSSWTVVSVAHRLETIKDYDLVLVMDSGRVVEMGRPDGLTTVRF